VIKGKENNVTRIKILYKHGFHVLFDSNNEKKITYFLFCNRRQIGNAGLGLWCHFQQCLSYIVWRSVLLVEETGGPGEIHRPESSH
jgi:hypothetical protein